MRLILILCLVLASTLSFSKGRGGKYHIAGIAYDDHKNPLANTTIEFQFKGQTYAVRTDDAGRYRLAIVWSTACPTHLTHAQARKITRNSNPKWINLIWDNKTVKIKNKWRKYSWTSSQEEERLTRNKNLRFDS